MEEYKQNTYVENIKIKGYLSKEYAIHKNDDTKEKIDTLTEIIAEQRKQEVIKYWEKFDKELKEPNDIPNLPTDSEVYQNYVIPALKRCGAIQLKDLKKDHFYYGEWRRGNFAKWNGEKFDIWRNKFDRWFLDDANHFENDNGYSLFVPIKEITEKEFLDRELNI